MYQVRLFPPLLAGEGRGEGRSRAMRRPSKPSPYPSPRGRGNKALSPRIIKRLAQKSRAVNCLRMAKRRASTCPRAYNAVTRHVFLHTTLYGTAGRVESVMYPRVILGRGRERR